MATGFKARVDNLDIYCYCLEDTVLRLHIKSKILLVHVIVASLVCFDILLLR